MIIAIPKIVEDIKKCFCKNLDGTGITFWNIINYNYLFHFEIIELITLSTGFITYVLWASGPIFKGSESNLMLLTCPLLLMGIFRYEYICEIKKDGIVRGESPTQILFTDLPIKIILITLMGACWLVTNYS